LIWEVLTILRVRKTGKQGKRTLTKGGLTAKKGEGASGVEGTRNAVGSLTG